MPIHPHLKAAKKWLANQNRKVKKSDFKDDECVIVIHKKGTLYLFHSALLKNHQEEETWFVAVFTLDQGSFIFPASELVHYCCFKWKPLEIEDILAQELIPIKE